MLVQRLFSSAATLLLGVFAATATLTWLSRDAAAQIVKAALVKLLDEPGRNPYQRFISFSGSVPSQNNTYSCQQQNPQNCSVFFSGPPAGKRLVVEHIHVLANAVSPNRIPFITVYAPQIAATMPVDFQGTVAGSDTFGGNLHVRTFIDAEVPFWTITVAAIPGNTPISGTIGVSGYLVELTP